MKKYVLIIAGILCLFASCENELPFDILSYLKSFKPAGITNAMIDDFVDYYVANK